MAPDSLVLQLQQDCLDRGVPVLDVLRKALVVAKKLKVPQLQSWIEHELHGYGLNDEIPEYRVVSGQIKALNPYRGWIPVVFDDPELTRSLSRRPIGQPIGELENILQNLGERSWLQVPFDPQLEKQIMEAGGAPMQPMLHVTQAATQGILDQVRTALLNWCLKLEEAGVIGAGMTFSQREVQSASQINYVVNFHHDATGAQIQQGTSHSSQSASASLDINALRELALELSKAVNQLGLQAEQHQQLIAEVKSVIAQLEAPRPNSVIVRESLKSVRNILEGCVGSVLGAALLQKIGLNGF